MLSDLTMEYMYNVVRRLTGLSLSLSALLIEKIVLYKLFECSLFSFASVDFGD